MENFSVTYGLQIIWSKSILPIALKLNWSFDTIRAQAVV